MCDVSREREIGLCEVLMMSIDSGATSSGQVND